jgi:AAA ATPase-like protein/CHAT domain-containing protein
VAGELTLTIAEYDGPARWRWTLADAGGAVIGDHTVIVDPGCWQFRALTGLDDYLRWHAAPDDPFPSQARIVADVGRWAGEQLFGSIGPELTARSPVTVRVVVPHQARAVAFLPLESAVVAGRPLALQRVSLVIQVDTERAVAARVKDPVSGRLRILALFSLPEGASALNLRRERYGLARLVEEIAATNNKAIELKVLQYGVTRQRLRSVAEQAEGWDVLHLSGHGLAGGLLLEHEDGTRDLVGTEDLVELLSPLVDRVKLVTASACSTAAVTAAEQLRLLGLGPAADPAGAGADDGAAGGTGAAGAPVSALAVRLAERLDVAVLAMRFPVTDDFAVGLAEGLYDRVIGKGQPLPGALGLALPPLLAADRHPPISLATPAVFGKRGAAAKVDAPRGAPLVFDDEVVKLSGFPAQPERFVGRTGVMARVNAALAPRSGAPGVLLHGMAGAGKTACALELAYTHTDDFQALAWHKAPDSPDDAAADLARFAACLDDKISGLNLAELVTDTAALRRFLPRLTEFCRRQRVLIVLDNAESLLTPEGGWRDPGYQLLLGALTGHSGLSRVVVTSRVPVRGLGDRVRAESLHALSRDEAVLLARELPRLRALMDGTAPGVGQDAGRALAARVLAMAQGHPRLLELADGQADGEPALRDFLAKAEREWDVVGGVPEGFLSDGESAAGAVDFARVLDGWTRSVAEELSPEAATFFGFLCALEEQHRFRGLIAMVWPLLCRHLRERDPVWDQLWADLMAGRPDGDGADDPAGPDGWSAEPGGPALGQPRFEDMAAAAPDPDELLAELAARGLADVRRPPGQTEVAVRIHPQVAAAGGRDADPALRAAVDRELVFFWVLASAAARPGESLAPGARERLAWREALPYLIRMRAWDFALAMLEQVVSGDQSNATALALLPVLRQLTEAVTGADGPESPRAGQAGILLARVRDRVEPETEPLDEQFGALLAADDVSEARKLLGRLVESHLEAGRPDEAERLAGTARDLTRQAGYGPWTSADDQFIELSALMARGRYDAVLDGVRDLLSRMETLPDPSPRPEAVAPWAVRENALLLGARAANEQRLWQQALDTLTALADAKRRRGAPDKHIAQTTFNMFGPLLDLGRLDEAEAVLNYCAEVYEHDGDVLRLGRVHRMRGVLAHHRDEAGPALELAREGLAVAYRHGGDPEDAAVGHQNLANELLMTADPAGAVGHLLAAALIDSLTRSARGASTVDFLALALAQMPAGAAPPADVATLCAAVNQVPGVRLDRLLAGLAPRRRGERAFGKVLREARKRDAGRLIDEMTARNTDPFLQGTVDDMNRFGVTPGSLIGPGMAAIGPAYMAFWDPVLAALKTAGQGPPDANGDGDPAPEAVAAELFEVALAEADGSTVGAPLSAALRRVAAGEREPRDLVRGLDPLDTGIVLRALAVLAGTITLPDQLWLVVPVRGMIMGVICAAAGFQSPADAGVGQYLAVLDANTESAPLARVLRQILAGTRDVSLLTRDLDPVQRAMVTTILTHLSERGSAGSAGPRHG